MIHKFRHGYGFPLHLINFGIATLVVVFVGGVRAAEPTPTAEASPNVEEVSEVSPDLEVSQAVQTDHIDDADLELPSEDGGFYPTIDETMLLGGDYPRSSGGGPNIPPDSRMQTEQGIYPYPNPGEGYRAPWAESLSPLNPYLGFFAPRQALVTEGENWPRGASLDLDATFPLLVRDFSPERAMFKAGPTYFDLLFVGMTVLHSDYQGEQNFDNDSEDGWLMGIEFGLRGMVQFTDQFYLSLAGTLVYLPLENDIGIRLGSGGAPSGIAELNYQFEYGTWDIRLYDNFYAGLGYDVFVGLDDGAYDRAGRYSFGFDDLPSNDYTRGDNTYFTNDIGFDASTPVWEAWRFWFAGKHSDTWRTWDFEDHQGRNSLFARLGYNGSRLMFSPGIEYYLDHSQNDDTVAQRVYLTLKGRLTENLSLEARAGYLWHNGNESYDDGYLYSVTLIHQLGRSTSHSLSFGKEYFNYDLTGESTVAEYIRYDIHHTFTRSLVGSASIQYSDQEGRSFDGERTTAAALLRYSLFNGNSSAILLRGAYEHQKGTQPGDRWLGRLSYTQALAPRLSSEFFYQYEEASVTPSFNEQLFGFTLRQYF